MSEHYAVNGKGDMMLSACCKDCMKLVQVEIAPNPLNIKLPDHPVFALECCTCGEIAKPHKTRDESPEVL